jgi:ABC-2 type transport system ATP-binding protein
VIAADYDESDSILTVRCQKGDHNLVNILSYLNQNKISCGRVFSELPTLNDVFLEITGKELRD